VNSLSNSPDGNAWSEGDWFAIQSQPFRETLAAASLSRLELETFLPLVKLRQKVCNVSRLVRRSLFPGYFFARFDPGVFLGAVRHSTGVLRVLGGAEAPIPIELGIVAGMQKRIASDGFFHLERRVFEPGDRVCVEEGPFAGFLGKVEREVDDGKRLAIFLDVMEQARLMIEPRALRRED
jgi:transcriptional antiterminator RfaH